MTFQGKQSCTKCAGKAQPGTVASLKYINTRFPQTGSLGIYNCRNIAGSTTKSQHACGRAADVKIPTFSNGRANTAIGNPVVLFLLEFSTELGITEVIYNRIIYDAKSPKGRYYGGVHPHYDHIHYTQTQAKATTLTFSSIIAFAGQPTTGPQGEDPMLGFTIGKLKDPSVGGSVGDPVGDQAQALQLALIKRGEKLPQFGADRFAGDETRNALRSFQSKNGISTTHPEYMTGTVGPHTHASLYAVAGAGGGISAADVDAKVATHAKQKASATVHPHGHDEGQTGPAI